MLTLMRYGPEDHSLAKGRDNLFMVRRHGTILVEAFDFVWIMS
jgi:hypothetical protein